MYQLRKKIKENIERITHIIESTTISERKKDKDFQFWLLNEKKLKNRLIIYLKKYTVTDGHCFF